MAAQFVTLELEIEQLTRKAEQADRPPLDTGLSLPEEIRRREDCLYWTGH